MPIRQIIFISKKAQNGYDHFELLWGMNRSKEL